MKNKIFRIKESPYFIEKYGIKSPEILIEGTDIEILGCSWQTTQSAVGIIYQARKEAENLPDEGKVYYGKINNNEELVHESELAVISQDTKHEDLSPEITSSVAHCWDLYKKYTYKILDLCMAYIYKILEHDMSDQVAIDTTIIMLESIIGGFKKTTEFNSDIMAVSHDVLDKIISGEMTFEQALKYGSDKVCNVVSEDKKEEQ